MKFYGQFNPKVDEVIYERYFKNHRNGTSIECGAFDGITESCTKVFEETLGWKTINIEPVPNIFDKLIVNRPQSININCALSNENCIKTFKNYKHPKLGYDWGNGSISHTEYHEAELIKLCGKDNYKTHTIECKTYKEIIKQHDLQKIDLFILDVEGHEYDVIDGMKGADIFPDVFVIEHGHRSPQEIQKKLSELPVKYVLDHTSFINSFFTKHINDQ